MSIKEPLTILVSIMLLFSGITGAATPAATAIVHRAMAPKSGDDLLSHLEHLDAGLHVVKRQAVRRQPHSDALRNGARTLLRQYDVKVNSGLSDNLFTKRFMKRGSRALQALLR